MRWTATRAWNQGDGSLWRVAVEGGRSCEVRVPLGERLLPRLESAVLAALGVAPAAPPVPPRLSIRVREHAHGGLFELELDTIWTVVDEAAGKPLWELRGGTSHGYALDGSGWSDATGAHGDDDVVMGADGLHVLARDGNEVQCHAAPGAG